MGSLRVEVGQSCALGFTVHDAVWDAFHGFAFPQSIWPLLSFLCLPPKLFTVHRATPSLAAPPEALPCCTTAATASLIEQPVLLTD